MQGKAIWQTLKKLFYRSSFVEPWLQSHICERHVDRSFFPSLDDRHDRRRSVICMEEAYQRVYRGYRGSYRTYRADMCTRLCMAMQMCTHARNGFSDSPKQTACTLFHGSYFIDADETRFLRGTFSIATHRLKFLCTLHKNRSHMHNSAA
jgi:hypothetical protein